MTVGMRGVAQAEAVPGVIHAAAAFLGRETKEPEVLLKRSPQKAGVEIGEPTVVTEAPVNIQPAPKK